MARRGDGVYKRGSVWYMNITINGRRYVEKIGRGISRSVAVEYVQVRRVEILRGELGTRQQRKDITFDQAAELFLEWVETNRRPRTLGNYSQCVEQLKRFFGGKRLSDISAFNIEAYKRKRKKDCTAKYKKKGYDGSVAANREVTTLRAIFNRCIDWGKFQGVNPCRGIKHFKETPRETYLTRDQEARLLVAATEPLRTIILCGIDAGLRISSEALTLQKTDIDLKRGLLSVQAAYEKGGERKTIPMNSRLREALARQIDRSRSDWVFVKLDRVTPYRSIRTAFTTACRSANIDGVTPHTLRHTFASRLAMAGFSDRLIQELGAWKDASMVARYAHLSPSHKAEAVEKILEIPQRFSQRAENVQAKRNLQVLSSQ